MITNDSSLSFFMIPNHHRGREKLIWPLILYSERLPIHLGLSRGAERSSILRQWQLFLSRKWTVSNLREIKSAATRSKQRDKMRKNSQKIVLKRSTTENIKMTCDLLKHCSSEPPARHDAGARVVIQIGHHLTRHPIWLSDHQQHLLFALFDARTATWQIMCNSCLPAT